MQENSVAKAQQSDSSFPSVATHSQLSLDGEGGAAVGRGSMPPLASGVKTNVSSAPNWPSDLRMTEPSSASS